MKPYFTRKESIIISAIEIIDELGINELSVRELASRQGVSEAALYRHFKNKEEIILEVFEYYSKYDQNIINTVNNSNYTAKEGIIFSIKSLMEFYESHPAISSLLFLYQTYISEDIVAQRAKDIFNSRWSFISYLIEKGQRDGSVGLNFKSEALSDIILGINMAVVVKWRTNKYNFSLKERVLDTLELLLNVC